MHRILSYRAILPSIGLAISNQLIYWKNNTIFPVFYKLVFEQSIGVLNKKQLLSYPRPRRGDEPRCAIEGLQ